MIDLVGSCWVIIISKIIQTTVFKFERHSLVLKPSSNLLMLIVSIILKCFFYMFKSLNQLKLILKSTQLHIFENI